ncbi:MAG TPA: Gfo/Idh/MocA family oxidoreductase [Draconibacterium sp.]|nr:Gfo/Idh/MocA family oxidoreductase [Draconibacterium sp.]
MKVWNFGIIGAGLIADFHGKAIQSLENARLTGICGTNQEKAQKLAKKYNCKKYNDFSEMLRANEIDVVTIATPSGAHMEPAIEAAKYGKHVICEKPLEITLKRIDKMIEAHTKAGTSLGGIFNFRFEETTEVIKQAVDHGRLGTITYAAVYVPWWRNDAYYKGWHGTWNLDGGGAMMNQSIHMVDLLQYIMGPVKSLAAFTSKLGHPQIETEDAAVGALQFKNNALGVIYGTTASYPGQFRRMEITGTKGTIVLLENSLEVWQFAEMNEKDDQIIQKYGKVEGGGGVADPAAISFMGHAKNIAAFLNALEEGRKFEINGTEARKAVEIILDMYRSAAKQIVVKK